MKRSALAPSRAPARRGLSFPVTTLVVFSSALCSGLWSPLHPPSAAAAELTAGNYLVMSGGQLFEVDRSTGDRELLGPSTFPSPWPNYGLGSGIAIDAHWNIYFSNADAEDIFRFDPDTDEFSVVSGVDAGGLVGSGPELDFPLGLTFGPHGELLVADQGLKAIVSIDPANGNRTIISGGPDNVGRGTDYFQPRDLLLTPSGKLLVGGGNGMSALLSIDLLSGDRIPISRSGADEVGDGPSLEWTHRLSPGPSGSILTTVSNAILQVDLETGDRRTIFEAPFDMVFTDTFYSGPDELLILDIENRGPRSHAGIHRFNTITGELEYFSYSHSRFPVSPDVGEGPMLLDPRFIIEIPQRIPEPGVTVLIAFVIGMASVRRMVKGSVRSA